MSNYVKKTLIGDEQVVYSGRISLWSIAIPILIGVLLLPAFGAGLIFLLYAWIKYISTELAFTDKRVIAKVGFIKRDTVELNIVKVESIQVLQSILGRMLNFGTLIVSGAGNPQTPIKGISRPMKFRKSFMEQQNLTNN